MGLISLIGLARHGTVPVPLAVWTPKACALLGITLMIRLEKPGDRDWIGSIRTWLKSASPAAWTTGPFSRGPARRVPWRFPLLPQLIDAYVLNSYFFYFGLLAGQFRGDDPRVYVL